MGNSLGFFGKTLPDYFSAVNLGAGHHVRDDDTVIAILVSQPEKRCPSLSLQVNTYRKQSKAVLNLESQAR
jgi:hypothetical protein